MAAQKGASAAPAPRITTLPLARFSVEEYHLLLESKVIAPSKRTELLEGLVVEKMTRLPPHDVSLTLLQQELPPRLPEGWIVRSQCAITTSESEPEPDFAIVKGPARRYARRHPRRADVAFIVEVADSTLDEDRDWKGRIYARTRIPIYWIVNIPDRRVEVYTRPRGGRNPAYLDQHDYGPDDMIPLVIADEQVGEIAARDILP
jgi:Uma2 family endonuclease